MRGLDAALENQVRAVSGTASPRVSQPASGSDNPSVLLADDDLGTRHGMRLVLEAAGMDSCVEAADADSVIEEVLRNPPDICLIDLTLPGGGLSAGGWICSNAPDTALSSFASSQIINGDLPPSSNVMCLSVLAASAMTALPVPTEPVTDTF